MEIGIAVAAVAVVVAALIYFAQRQNATRETRAAAIQRVTHDYISHALQFSGITGALRAGVLSLPDGEAVAEFLDACADADETCLASTYRSELRNEELLDFFTKCAAANNRIAYDDGVREIIHSIQNSRRT